MASTNDELNLTLRNLSRLTGYPTNFQGLGYQAKIDLIYKQSQRLNYFQSGTNALNNTVLTFASVTSTSFIANWTAVTNAINYVVAIGTSVTGSDGVVQTTANVLTYTFTNGGNLTLTVGTQYYVTIHAIDISGNSSTTIGSVTIPASSPTFMGGSLVAWYDATDQASLTLAGSLVSQWNDKSGNAHHLTAAGGARPTNNTSGGSNNLAYISFLGGFKAMSVALSQAQPYNFWFVLKQDTTYIDLSTAIQFTGNQYDGIRERSFTYNSIFYKYLLPANNAQYGSPVVGFGTTAWSVWEARFNGSGDNFLLLNDGVSTAGATGTNAMTQLLLGDSADGAMVSFSEMMVVSGTPTITQRNAMRAYLMNKYGIAPLASASSPQPPMLFFGDSITYGQNATALTVNSFAALTCFSKSFTDVNLGVPGSTVFSSGTNTLNFTTQVLSALNSVYLNGHVFMQYGTNDGVWAQKWTDIYTSLIQKLIDFGFSRSKIILGTQPYQPTNRPGGISFVNAAAGIATALKINFFNAWTYMQANGGESLLSVDLLHPTDAGHAVYAAGLAPYIL